LAKKVAEKKQLDDGQVELKQIIEEFKEKFVAARTAKRRMSGLQKSVEILPGRRTVKKLPASGRFRGRYWVIKEWPTY
jgi:hypothetical protein